MKRRRSPFFGADRQIEPAQGIDVADDAEALQRALHLQGRGAT